MSESIPELKGDKICAICGVKKELSDFHKDNVRKDGRYPQCKTFDIVGCTPIELKKHLEKQFTEGMCWENYGYYGWHIDHKIPLSSGKNKEEIIKLSHYTNLQPLWRLENEKKGFKF